MFLMPLFLFVQNPFLSVTELRLKIKIQSLKVSTSSFMKYSVFSLFKAEVYPAELACLMLTNKDSLEFHLCLNETLIKFLAFLNLTLV
jgi:hypothetical protein